MKTNRSSTSSPSPSPSVVFSPNLMDGFDAMANAVKSTLGPLPRLVGIERMERARMPELLDDAGVIARRIIQIPDPNADVGAMMLRHGMWRMHERFGDGAATMAVLAQAIMREAVKGAAAGMHPLWIKRGIDAGADAAVKALRAQAREVPAGKLGRTLMTSLAYSLSADKELMDALVAIVQTIGADGGVEVVVNERRAVDYEFIEGAMWDSGWISPAFTTDKAKTIERQEDVAVIILDAKIETPQQALAAIQRLHALGMLHVALIVTEISSEALNVFIQVHQQDVVQFVLIKPPYIGEERMTALRDIGLLTGAQILFDVGELMALKPEDAGFARRLWATGIKFGIIAGHREGEALRQRIAGIRQAIENFNDRREWSQLGKLRWRLAQLTGGIASLRVGAATRTLADTRKEHAERLLMVLQGAVGSGLVAGGGASLVACCAAVDQAASKSANADEKYGMRCVAKSLSTPLGVLAHNAGYDPSPIITRVKEASSGCGFNARTGELVDMWEAGIVDSLAVVERAVQTAASVAAMAITTTSIVHLSKHYGGQGTP